MWNGPLLAAGPWAVVYAISGAMVDVYLDVAAHVEKNLERLEETAFVTDRSPGIPQMYQLKRELVEFKTGCHAAAGTMSRFLDLGDLPDELRPCLVDVRGRLASAVDRVGETDVTPDRGRKPALRLSLHKTTGTSGVPKIGRTARRRPPTAR